MAIVNFQNGCPRMSTTKPPYFFQSSWVAQAHAAAVFEEKPGATERCQSGAKVGANLGGQNAFRHRNLTN